MKKIGILSDTHGYFDTSLENFFKECDEIWHAGDIGNLEVVDSIKRFKFLRAVYGNIDGHEIRKLYGENLRFWCEDVEVWITHIAGYPGRYKREVKEILKQKAPGLLICGHSHILKVMYDKDFDLLYINPGAAGKFGFHKMRTAIRLVIDGTKMRDLEVLEIDRK
ncbi:MAG: metallophosphoesterase family protein [Bacteroidales bacterium]|nr:metallophosphoesterase family protein [Bacteroidales bacterium]